jgi:hypothetical protein
MVGVIVVSLPEGRVEAAGGVITGVIVVSLPEGRVEAAVTVIVKVTVVVIKCPTWAESEVTVGAVEVVVVVTIVARVVATGAVVATGTVVATDVGTGAKPSPRGVIAVVVVTGGGVEKGAQACRSNIAWKSGPEGCEEVDYLRSCEQTGA